MKKKKKINLEERIKIEINYCVKFISLREIARILDRDASSISREIGDKDRKGKNKYQARIAHAKSLERRAKRKNWALIVTLLILIVHMREV